MAYLYYRIKIPIPIQTATLEIPLQSQMNTYPDLRM